MNPAADDRITYSVATYGQLTVNLPTDLDFEMMINDDISTRRDLREQCGVLLQTPWYRVLLDEGHAVRNQGSQSRLGAQGDLEVR